MSEILNLEIIDTLDSYESDQIAFQLNGLTYIS